MSKKSQIHCPSKHHHHHHHPYVKFTNVQCSATPQRPTAPSTEPWPITGCRYWTRLTERRVPTLCPAPPSPCPPSATARFPPSPPHLACTNTNIHNNTNELWLGLLFQSSFIVGRGIGSPPHSANGLRALRCCINIDDSRGWPLGQPLCRAQGRSTEFFCRGGASAAASKSKLLTVTALLVALPSEASLPLPLPLSRPLSHPLSLPLGESPMSDWGSPLMANSLHQLQCADAASLTAMAKCAAHCHLPRARARAARTRRMSPHATDQAQPTPVGHFVQYIPYPSSLPFSVPWPLPYTDRWGRRIPP